ncbi:hypothetical protein E1A91_A10G109500v1 [Gossypium mustelinum]|uniref:Uncharacterized protein n=1 Tax=Gossypium mustelinum TaxID=34275 RepID=A0A5D2XK61_GOSMU|nr:hypothetical protein E1A91_A10G109500v1 [Gossypium mustelinum]
MKSPPRLVSLPSLNPSLAKSRIKIPEHDLIHCLSNAASKLIFTKGSLGGLQPSSHAFLSATCWIFLSCTNFLRDIHKPPIKLVQTSIAKGHSLKTCSMSSQKTCH